jgi:hypothetical protein
MPLSWYRRIIPQTVIERVDTKKLRSGQEKSTPHPQPTVGMVHAHTAAMAGLRELRASIMSSSRSTDAGGILRV